MKNFIQVFKQRFKPIWAKFITRRKENGDIYGAHVENVVKEVTQDYAGKALLILGFIIAAICKWHPSQGAGNFEGFQMLITLALVFWIFIFNGVTLIFLISFTFFRKNKHPAAKILIWLDSKILSPMSNELNNNILGFIISNIILLAFLYDHSWIDLTKAWRTNQQGHLVIIFQAALFVCGCVILPLVICWINTFVSRFINAIKTIEFKKG